MTRRHPPVECVEIEPDLEAIVDLETGVVVRVFDGRDRDASGERR